MIQDNTPARLHLALDARGRYPAVVVTRCETKGGMAVEQHIRVSARSPRPNLTGFDRVDEIDAPDVLEHTRDEACWLEALAALARPGATLRLRVPRQGPLTWADALNVYSYLVSVTDRGHKPRETRPIGWHRAYTEDEAIALVEAAGFRIDRLTRSGVNLGEPPRLAALLLLDWALGHRGAERHARRLAQTFAPADLKLRAGPLATRLEIVATRV